MRTAPRAARDDAIAEDSGDAAGLSERAGVVPFSEFGFHRSHVQLLKDENSVKDENSAPFFGSHVMRKRGENRGTARGNRTRLPQFWRLR